MSRDRERLFPEDEEYEQSARPARVPGKRTLTDGLVPGAGQLPAPLDVGAAWASVQRKASGPGAPSEDAGTALQQAASSGGEPLPATLRERFEPSLGVDLSRVRVHTGADSARAADAVQARAYTVGQDIHFGDGEYDPSSADGARLIAHEVAHTVQQRGGAATQYKLEVSQAGDAAEVEADAAAAAMLQGAPFAVGAAPGLVAREEKAKSGATIKFTEVTWPLVDEKKFVDANVSFLKFTLSAGAQFKGSVGVKDADGTKATGTSALFPPGLELTAKGKLKTLLDEGGGELTFDPGGWIGFKELAIAGFEKGPGKGNVGKVTFFKGQVKYGKSVLGEVKLSVAAFSWDGLTWENNDPNKKPSVKVFPIEATGEVNLCTLEGQLDVGGGVLAAGGKIIGALKGSVAVDPVRLGLMMAEELAVSAGTEGLMTALGVLGGEILAPMAAGVMVGITILELMDELDVDNVTQEAFADASRASSGFENEMKAPGHEYKPSIFFFKNDPYKKGVEAASGLKSRFFNTFLNHPKLGKWRQSTPADQHQSSMEAAYRRWITGDAYAAGLIAATASRLKLELNARIMGEHFVQYAQRQGLFSRRDRILRLFDQLWPGATWLDPVSRMMPLWFPATIPRECYMIAHRLAPVAYPEDLTKWQSPPTLI